MKDTIDLIRRARATQDPSELARWIPYSRFLGIEMAMKDDDVLGTLRFSERLIGNNAIPALHGGTIGALLETTAVFAALMKIETLRVPKLISFTIDYLRSGKPVDTFASAELTKLGRRVASLRAIAWQDDRAKPIAAANAHLLLLPIEDERA
jgi:uncharacterized protein (TIGR00369 family)